MLRDAGVTRPPARSASVDERDRVCVDCGSEVLHQYDHVPEFQTSGQTVVDELELRCAPVPSTPAPQVRVTQPPEGRRDRSVLPWSGDLSRDPVGDRKRRQVGDRGCPGPSRARARGVKVYGYDKDGVDAGEICGIDPVGVAATTDDDAVLALDADCVVYTPVLANRDEVRSILASGKNVVTPVGWLYPFVADRVLGHVEDEPILRAAIDGGVTLHGTGIHPGGITERFPLMVSGLVSDVRHVRAEEFSDIRSYAAEFVVREIMMFGKSPEETANQFDESPHGRALRRVDLHARRGARLRSRRRGAGRSPMGGGDRARSTHRWE